MRLESSKLTQNKDFYGKHALKCIRIGIIIYIMFIAGGIETIKIDGRKSCFTALLLHLCKTKFPPVYPLIYILNIWLSS